MRKLSMLLIAGWALSLAGCGPDPKTVLTVEFRGSLDDGRVRDALFEATKTAVRGAQHAEASYGGGDALTIEVAPVFDVNAFVKRLGEDLQKAIEAPMAARFVFAIDAVEGRTVRVSIQ